MKTPSRWSIRKLAECGRLISGGTPSKSREDFWIGNIPWFSSKELKSFDLIDSELHLSSEGARGGLVPPGTVLFVVRGMSLANELRVGVTRQPSTFNQDVKAIIPAIDVDSNFLARYLRWIEPAVLGATEESSHGTKRLTSEVYENLKVPVPPVAEQRRIADILDRADSIRRKRRESIDMTEKLLFSIFLEMFSDSPVRETRWQYRSVNELLSAPLRNGLSPSEGGPFVANVLTLSSITQGSFDPTACKQGTFKSAPPTDVRVDESDFLICRGNGNKRLVGSARFPVKSNLEVVFPDTMIAARIDPSAVGRFYLETVWCMPEIRGQIEAGAKTTNGTFKINQTLVESISIPVPPRPLQTEFERRAAQQRSLLGAQRRDLTHLDTLFASLAHDAFRGALTAPRSSARSPSQPPPYEELLCAK